MLKRRVPVQKELSLQQQLQAIAVHIAHFHHVLKLPFGDALDIMEQSISSAPFTLRGAPMQIHTPIIIIHVPQQ
jgi:hypothetical protein